MQITLFDDIETIANFFSTRYRDSKSRYVDWIWHCVNDLLSFGNKVTWWDTPFSKYFRQFVNEASGAVFYNNKNNRSINLDVFDVHNNYDLVYMDPPYISNNGVGVNYADFYHFLDGIVNYDNWSGMIDYDGEHRGLQVVSTDWTNSSRIEKAFERLFEHFRDSILVIFYCSDGIQSIKQIVSMLEHIGENVRIHQSRENKYVLSNKHSAEVLIIGV